MNDQTIRCYRVLNNEFNIVDMYKCIHPVNRNMLFNRWVPPSVAFNNDVYIVDTNNYRDLYILCLQKDIKKNNNTMSNYKSIQQIVIQNSDYNEYDFVWNKAFNVIDYETQKLHEIRILYAYFICNEYTLENVRWRLFIDDLKLNITVKSSLVKKLMMSSYSNSIIQLSLKIDKNFHNTSNTTLSTINDKEYKSIASNKNSSKSSYC